MKKLHAHEIAAMTREEVLRTLAMAQGVPEESRRMAELTLAGPQIAPAEEEALRGKAAPYNKIALAVACAYA